MNAPSSESLEGLARALISDLRDGIKALSDRLPADEDSYAIQSWLIYLTMLAYDAARGAVDLFVAGNTRAAIILQRQVYEYTVRATYYLREPSDGIKSFKARKARHYNKIQNLRIRADLRQFIDEAHAEWKRANPEVTDDYGGRKFNKMALQVDGATGYTYHYEVPSIWVHAPLVGFDVFDLSDEHVRISTQSVHMRPEVGIASIIVILLRYVRTLFKIGMAPDPSQYEEGSKALSAMLARDLGLASDSVGE